MLALLFRGVFLVGVIGWYSASLWKAVDHYFKGQFQRYLEEEYQRNPRMRDDVRAYTTTADKVASDVIADKRLTEIACGGGGGGENVCPIDKAELLGALREVKSQESVPGDFGAGATEIEVARSVAHTDQQAAFRDCPVDEAVLPRQIPSLPSSPKAIIRDYKIDESSNFGEIEQAEEKILALKQKQQRKVVVEEEEEEEGPKKDEQQPSPRLQKSTKASKKAKIEATSEVATKRKIEQRPKIKILKLTEEDFEEAARFYEDDGNRDFLDNFEDENEDFTGIALKDLPFKPLIDIYDLERVSEDEYCPLSLDDDPTCDELRSWP